MESTVTAELLYDKGARSRFCGVGSVGRGCQTLDKEQKGARSRPTSEKMNSSYFTYSFLTPKIRGINLGARGIRCNKMYLFFSDGQRAVRSL
jgi:hypothetical protein